VGRNLCVRLRQDESVRLIECDVDSPPEILETGLRVADVIFHLAGVNRPEKPEDYEAGNAGFTNEICDRLAQMGLAPHIIFTSSIQAELDNPYGVSKRKAEEELMRFAEGAGAGLTIFRMKNVFGKWCRPNYNSVVATFCHNIAHDLPLYISDPSRIMELVYVDDVCAAMMGAAGLNSAAPVHCPEPNKVHQEIAPAFEITLGALAERIKSFRDSRSSLHVPAFDDDFTYKLYATYLSYLEGADFAYGLDLKADNRGNLAEFLKSPSFGQIFVSRTKPGITRGNHYHHTKTEKFLVVQGRAVIRFRHILGDEIIEHRVSGDQFRVLDIPPGYTHSIENVGEGELVTLFWANEVFNPDHPDTFFDEVLTPSRERQQTP
jgi:UDP-2-acetamido-2,6-beta-L-arabino-hexul-4-ose reductase